MGAWHLYSMYPCCMAILKSTLVLFQPRNDLEPLMDTLNEYKGILGQFPDVLKVHEVTYFSTYILFC